MEASNEIAKYLSDNDDRRLFKSRHNSGLASTILRIKRNDPELTHLALGVTDLDDRAWARLGYILGQASCVEDLSLRDCRLNPAHLGTGLQFNKSINRLYISSIDLSSGNVLTSLLPFLRNNPSLKELTLRDCNLGPGEVNSISDTLLQREVHDLREIDLCHNRFGDMLLDEFVLALSKNKKLNSVELSWTGIGLRGCTSISKLLASPNCEVDNLHLMGNSIDDTAVTTLVDSLDVNKHLKYLYLNGDNEISTEGWKSMLELLCNSSSIEAIVNSNHTLCSVVMYCPRDVKSIDNALGINDANFLRGLLKQNWNTNKNVGARRKIIWSHVRGALNIGDSSIAIGAIPEILGWIGDDSNDTNANLILYHNPPLPEAKVGALRLDSIFRIVRSRPDLCSSI